MNDRSMVPLGGETLVEWPHCPACGAARVTECPACGTEGASWEQAFGPTAAEFERAESARAGQELSSGQHRVAVICPTCDEVFRPVFARRCAACKHVVAERDAGEPRLLTESAKPRRSTAQTLRVVLTAVAIAVVIYTLYDWLMSNTGGVRLF